jgi:hypothetical protein
MQKRWMTALVPAVLPCACSIGPDERGERAPPPVESKPAYAGELRRVSNEELTPALMRTAERVLEEHNERPIGTEIPLRIGGKQYVARIEEHYHPPGGEQRPYGHHKGVSLFVRQ